jgi:hypothetical protein
MRLKRLLNLMLIILLFVGQLTVSAAELLVPPTEIKADSYRWLYAKAFNGMNSTAMVVDNDNNTYFSGFSFSDIKFDNHTTTIDFDTERSAIVVIKLNAQNEFQWTKKINLLLNSPSTSFNVRSMDVDSDGNMYFGGDFVGSVTVNSQVYNSESNYGYFILKTNSAGVVQWFKAGTDLRGSVAKVKFTPGKIAFIAGIQMAGQSPDLFGYDLLDKFGSLEHFSSCDMIVGALALEDGNVITAQGIKTNQTFLTILGYQSTMFQKNTLDADSQGNLYITGGFEGNELLAAGSIYNVPDNVEATSSQFLLKIDVFGGVSWVKIFTNSTGYYPSIAINNNSGIAVLFNGGSAPLYIGDQLIQVNGSMSQYNHIALFNAAGELLKNTTINAGTLQIAPSQNGAFCVAGNLKQNGQTFGMDWLENGTSTLENLFVGFFDNNLISIAGQSVISDGRFMPVSIKTGVDGKIRLLGTVSNPSESGTPTYPFGQFQIAYPSGDNPFIYSVIDPKQLVKAQIFTHGIDCGRFALNVNPNIKSRVEWYVNDVLKGTDFSLMGSDQQGGYKFLKGINYIKAVVTDSTDATNFAIVRDTIEVYEPVVNINTQINPQTGVVDYKVTVSNFAPQYTVNIDRGNYDYAQELIGSYTYTPGEHTITVILNEPSNHNCFFRYEKTFVVPTPETVQECNRGVIKGRVESTIASFLAGEVRVDLFEVVNGSQHVYLKSDTIDTAGEFNIGGLSEGQYILRANIIDPTKYPQLLVTYFNDIMNQVVYWQEATPIVLTCNLWADVNLTFAALNEAMNGTGSISGVISYSSGASGAPGAKASVKASSQIADALMSNVPVILRKKSNQEIVARTVTDENGIYVFENLIEDEYEILVEIPGTEMVTTYDVTIDESVENVENRNFVVTNSGINTTTQLAVVATATEHGTITPVGTTMLNPGENMSYSITPSVGYAIQDVLVNGVSVGAVTSYNFTNISTNQSIHAVFNSITGLDNNDLNKLIVYPAVFDNHIIVSGLSVGSEIRILNQLGVAVKVVRNLQVDNLFQIETASLSAGVYFIEIFNADQRIKTLKAIKK